ncbi:MAG: HAMP domain-containing sensor histidine kinase [Candidatus Margulisiibacteriota bacterium]
MKACEEKVEGKSIYVEVSETDEGKFLVLTVRDTGIGIDPDQLDKIFKPFYTKRKNLQGTGLGLAIVKKVVEDARGSVCVTSEYGQGTCFTINLPCCPNTPL